MPPETQVRELRKKVSRRFSSQALTIVEVKLSFLQKCKKNIFAYINWPVFVYALSIHLTLFGLALYLYRSHDIEKIKPLDIQQLRYQAYVNAKHQVIKHNSVDIDMLVKTETVYLAESSGCIQVQLNKPIRGRYVAVIIEKGVLTLGKELVDNILITKM